MSLFRLRLFNLKRCRNSIYFFSAQRTTRIAVTPYHIQQQENLMINQVLNTNKSIKSEKWIEIRNELLDSTLPITIHNIDAVIVERCHAAGNIEAAVNYIKFLLSTNQNINLGTINKFFTALFHTEIPLNKEIENLIIKLYEDVRAKYSILDLKTAQCCLYGLSLTRRWKEYKELIQMCGGQSMSLSPIYEIIASAALNHDDPDEAWDLIKVLKPNTCLSLKFSDSYLNYCIRNSKNAQDIESYFNKIFEFYSHYDIHPTYESINKYGDYLKKVGGWQCNKTKINSVGSCVVCGQQLNRIQITPDDFKLLKTTFTSKVLVGNDIYCNTTPEEWVSFQKFIESTKPYDVVIDGLNVSFLSSQKQPKNRACDLMKVVEAFVKQNKKIFILGRKHMNNWKLQEMNYVRAHAHIYLANDLTNDDTFLLYAALSSGIETYFCSRDLMRQHKYLLANDHLQTIFRSWQMTRQIYPVSVGGPHNKQFLLVYPKKIANIAQRNSNGDWHIPYRLDRFESNTIPLSWLCLKKKHSH